MMEERYEERRESKQVCRIVESSIEKKIFRFCVDVVLSIDLVSVRNNFRAAVVGLSSGYDLTPIDPTSRC